MVTNYPKHKTLVDSFEWHIMPVLNPDGYEFSRSQADMASDDQ
jgi:murein tripeptide amidase MpaA